MSISLARADCVMDKNEIAILIQKLKKGQASNKEKEMLEEYWKNALNDNSAIEEMSAVCCEELKQKIFHAIQVRLGLK